MVFKHPVDDLAIVKRCVALPGDTIEIVNDKIYVNSILFEEEPTVKSSYILLNEDGRILNHKSDQLDSVNNARLAQLSKIESSKISPSNNSFGPYIIPFNNWTLSTNDPRFDSYLTSINEIDLFDNRIMKIEGKYYLDGQQITQYTFTKNYYFMIGDYRSYSRDSRHWGPVPEENIFGKATIILFSSNDKITFNWKRFIKKLK